ncbi:MAG: hypothetical protein ACOVOQ_14565 [Flavobacterium sp.]
MNEDQAQTMIDLLVEISNKLTEIQNQISSKYEVSTISEKLDHVISKLGYIESNTSN